MARQRPFLVIDDGLRCVACHLCESACPTDALYFEAEVAGAGPRAYRPRTAELDLDRCLVCGQCVASCPEDALQLAERGAWSGATGIDLLQEPLASA